MDLNSSFKLKINQVCDILNIDLKTIDNITSYLLNKDYLFLKNNNGFLYTYDDLMIISYFYDKYTLTKNYDKAFLITLSRFYGFIDHTPKELNKAFDAFKEFKKVEMVNANKDEEMNTYQALQLYIYSGKKINVSKLSITKREAAALIRMHENGINIYYILSTFSEDENLLSLNV